MNILDCILLLFGATFVYAGVLIASQNAVAAAIVVLIGVLLSIRPVVRLVRYFQITFGGGFGVQLKNGKRGGKRRGHLKIVKTEKEKPPTYH